jgi:hypothetical protein
MYVCHYWLLMVFLLCGVSSKLFRGGVEIFLERILLACFYLYLCKVPGEAFCSHWQTFGQHFWLMSSAIYEKLLFD